MTNTFDSIMMFQFLDFLNKCFVSSSQQLNNLDITCQLIVLLKIDGLYSLHWEGSEGITSNEFDR
jgi:hypothetical protein